MSSKSITLVGRATELAFKEFESGVTLASFKLAVKVSNQTPTFVFLCKGYGTKIAEQLKLMDEECLVSVSGKPAFDRNAVISLDCLKYLGKPLAQDVTA